MNILVLDNDKLVWQGLDNFKLVENSWSFFSLQSMLENNFSYGNMDLIIIDIADERNQLIYVEILEKHKNIRLIVLSETLKSCINNDCSFCIENHQMRRLMKPMELDKLYNLIKQFDLVCDFYNSFGDLCNLLSSVIKRFSSLVYDDINKEVRINMASPSNIHTNEFISFINILEQNSVKYLIIDESKIKII